MGERIGRLPTRLSSWNSTLTSQKRDVRMGHLGRELPPPDYFLSLTSSETFLVQVPRRPAAVAACVFITIGPYQATGSSSGLPETSRKRMPSSPACTVTSSPRSKRTSERLSASAGGVVSSPADAFGRHGQRAGRVAELAAARRRRRRRRGAWSRPASVLRWPGGTETSR